MFQMFYDEPTDKFSWQWEPVQQLLTAFRLLLRLLRDPAPGGVPAGGGDIGQGGPLPHRVLVQPPPGGRLRHGGRARQRPHLGLWHRHQ